MRVAWVHPSWRDLVIESLAGDAEERRRFLSRCAVDGAALALSWAGGAGGERRFPLLVDDADWDALGDGLHRLTSDLDDGDAARLLAALAQAGEHPELPALSELVLTRLARRWHGKVEVDALIGWLALAARQPQPPPLPTAVKAAWVELVPREPPRTLADLERLDDWTRLAEALPPAAARQLGWPAEVIDAFAADAPSRFTREPERALAIAILRRLPPLDPPAGVKAKLAADALRALAPLVGRDIPFHPPEPWDPAELGGFDVDRVLRDLGD